MIKKIEDLNYYELLEVSPTASYQEIHRAYERVRKIYEPNSIALYSLFSPEETAAIHRMIDEAYRTLMYDSHRKRYDERLRKEGRLHAEEPVVPGTVDDFGSDRTSESLKEKSSGDVQFKTPEPPQPFNAEFTGSALRFLREQRNFTIHQVSEMTKISGRYIELIEEEDYRKLPARAYLRGFLMLLAKALGYDPDRVVNDYLRRYDAASGTKK